MLLTVALLLNVATAQEPEVVKGRYRLPPQGFSVVIPSEATGLREGEPAVERGIRIALPSGASIFVFGEPNSAEFPTVEDGLRSMVAAHPQCAAGPVTSERLGKVRAGGVRIACADRVLRLLLAFRPGGGPIYWLRLETTSGNEAQDQHLLAKVAASFRLIPWK